MSSSCKAEGEEVGGAGFLFAFKTYIPHNESNVQLDCIENLVHHLTHSDLIHVEIIPVLEYDPHTSNLLVSPIAHTAYVGCGYAEHHSSTCIEDPSYQHVFVPVSNSQLFTEGVCFLNDMQGKRYNYLALPLTILPESCKFRAICPSNGHTFDTHKIFCSQMGLILCYLSEIIRPTYHYHGKSIIFDPLCCTPANLYELLLMSQEENGAILCPANKIQIADTICHDNGHLLSQHINSIYDDEIDSTSFQNSNNWYCSDKQHHHLATVSASS